MMSPVGGHGTPIWDVPSSNAHRCRDSQAQADSFRSMLVGILLYSIAVIFQGYVPISGFFG